MRSGNLLAGAVVLLLPASCAAATLDARGDPLPDGALARVGTLRLRHAGEVMFVVFAPDGKSMASSGKDGLIRLWDVGTGKEIRRFTGHKGCTYGLAFSPDGKTLLSAGDDKPRLWDVATGKERLALPGTGAPFYSVAYAPDGKTVATIAERFGKGTVRLWDAATGRMLHALPTAADGTNQIAFTPDGKALVAVGNSGSLRLLDPATGKEVRTFAGLKVGENSLDVSHDGKRLVTAGSDGRTCVWDLATGKQLRQWRGGSHDEGYATSARFSPDGKRVASVGPDGTVRVWDIEADKEVAHCVGHAAAVWEVAFSPDGKVLATASLDHAVRLWDAATGKELPQSAGPAAIARAALSADGKLLVTGHQDNDVRLWDPATGKPLARASLEFTGPVTALAISGDGRLIAAGNRGGDFALWESATGKKRFTVEGARTQPDPEDGVAVLAFLPDGQAVAAVRGQVGGIEVYDTTKGKRLASPLSGIGHDGKTGTLDPSPDALVFGPDGSFCVTNNPTGGVAVSDVTTGKVLRRFGRPSENEGPGLALSPDGCTVARSAGGGTVRLWETATGGQRGQLGPDEEGTFAVAFSLDGRLLAASGEEGVVRLWQLPGGRELRSFAGHSGRLRALAFAAGGKLLSVGTDGTALVWDTSDLKPKLPERPGKIDAEAAWSALADEDAAKAYDTMTRLGESPAVALRLLRERLKPADAADARRTARLIAQLDDDDFDKREEASRELAKLGGRAEGALRKAVKAAASAEVVRRAGDLLRKLEEAGLSGERLRERRALEVLEGLGTPEAKRLLEELAKGAPNATLTLDAEASLKRLTARAAAP
jgi:WD40 repeat protein